MDDEIKLARLEMLAARQAADEAAALYRKTVADAVAGWQSAGMSQRAAAKRLGMTESSLRDLLRPVGASRRKKNARRTPPGGTA